MTYPNHLDKIEKRIIDVLVKDILAAGHKVEVYGDGDLDLPLSDDYEAITNEVAACSQTEFVIPYVGWVLLIHGNGCEVLSDYTANPATEALVKRASDLGESLQ